MNFTAASIFELQGETARAYDALWSDEDQRAGNHEIKDAAQDKYTRLKADLDAAHAIAGGRVYRVPNDNLAALDARVEKLNRRAVKLGVEPIMLKLTDETWDHVRQGDGGATFVTPHTFVIVSSNPVKLNGYRFAATIEHDDEGNIVRTVPGIEADFTAFRTVKPWCDHCRTVRRRIDTFVVLHEDGHTRQIGRNCLVDFLGASATAAAQQAQWMIDFEDALENASREGSGSSSGTQAYDLTEFLTHVALMVRTDGWLSRGAAWDYNKPATADTASSNMYECIAKRYREPVNVGQRNGDWHTLPTEADRAEAEAAVAHARETFGSIAIEERSDFDHNMTVATAKDFIVPRRFGLAAYAVQARRKAIEKAVKTEAQAKTKAESEFVGQPKDKLVVEVTLARTNAINGAYGTTTIYSFVDASGNSLTWFSSNDLDLENGESYTVKGTVKGHKDDPRFGKTTLLTRCKIV